MDRWLWFWFYFLADKFLLISNFLSVEIRILDTIFVGFANDDANRD